MARLPGFRGGPLRRSLRLQLSIAFVLVAVIAMGAIALQVLPTLTSSLAQQRLRSLVRDTAAGVEASAAGPRGRTSTPRTERALVTAVAARTGADVTLYAQGPRGDVVARRSSAMGARDDDGDAGRRAAAVVLAGGRDVRSVQDGGDRLRAVVAVRVPSAVGGPTGVVVVGEDLGDVRATVDLVRRRALLGGALGILIAALTGTAFAVGLSTRIRRLEHGSREVAAGRFTTRFDVDAADELGSLSRSLDTMQRQLRELDSSRKRFIATASHELRTPLQSLSGFIELLQSEELDEAEREQFLDQLATQVRRLTRLSYDLLDLSKLESGGLHLRPERTDLHALAQGVAEEFRPVVERDGRRLTVRLVGEPVEQWCDPERVAQVVRILVDNALKHSSGAEEVEVRVSRGGGAARIAVSDRGTGISPEDLPRVFEPFHGTGDGSGAGLGLAIARELAHRMRGTLAVQAREPGESGTTTFILELPA